MKWLRLICLVFALYCPALAQEQVLKVGDKVPNFTLVNQDGKQVSLNDFKGKVILVTFLYTRCPYPDKCPMLADKLGKTRELLDKLDARDRFQVLSISIDPKNDTPERLKAYAQGHEKDAVNWAFLTGRPEDVARVAALFGVIYWEEKGVVEHNIRTAVIDSDGRLNTILRGNDWKPGELGSVLNQLLPKKP